ncbi:MAG: class I SAM-dependent methyltransferase [Candidatus Dojkabacteria bacterium]
MGNKPQPDLPLYRKQLWEKEYSSRFNLPSTKADKPSRAMRRFIDEVNPKERNRALALGSGNGRNAFFLIESGFEHILGIEFAPTAIEQAKTTAENRKLSDRVEFREQSAGDPIDAPDRSFDLIIDMMTMHALTKTDREAMAESVRRLLAPGGYFVFYTIAGLTEYEGEKTAFGDLVESSPGPEPGSYRFDVEGDTVTEKGFTEEEITQMFPNFELVTLEPVTEFTPAFGDVYKRVYYYGVMQLPS